MPNKITYTITTSDGKQHQVSKENVDKYGIQSYADAYKGATIRMRDSKKGDYDIPLSHYNDARKQGLRAFSLEHLPSAPAKQQPRQAAPPKPHTTSVSLPTRPASKPTTGGKPMTAAEKAQAMNFAAGIQQGIQRRKQQFGTTMQRAKAQQKNPLNVQRVTLGVGGTKPTMTANKHVVQGENKLNAKTGKLEPTYITESGNVYQGDRTQADIEQNQIDDAKEAQLHPIDHELKEAYAERERLARELGRRGTELDAEALKPSWRDMPRGSGGAIHTFNSATSNGRLADDEWKALLAAKNQNQQRIVALEAERDKAEAGFWRGVTDTFKNPSFWTFGYTDMLDTSAMLNYGGKKKQREKYADQAMIENTYKNQVAQNKYGNNRNFMYRAGGITAQAIPFMIEFAATDGLSGLTRAGTKLGTKIAEKVATKALTKKLIKYTGTTLGDIAAGVVMANTTGAARTASDIGQRHLGHVEQDEHGNYRFVGGEDWGTAIRKGEIAQTLEYYTEKLGAHLEGLPIGKTIAKGLDKIGLSKVTAALNRAGTSQYAQLGTKVMNRVGVNGYINEVVEEEANIVLNYMFVGDNKMSDLFDGRTQADIWGGMLFSAGAMEAAPKLAGAVDYYKTKKNVKDADTVAAYRMTQGKWQPLREKIDNATNEKMADVVNGIIQNPDLYEQEKKAALNYAGNLIKFRGFNTAQSTKAKELEETGAKDDETIIHQSMDNAYIQGHEASDEQKNDIKTRYEYTEQQLSEALGAEDVSGYSVDDFLDNKENLNDKQKQAAIDYLNAKSAYNGMISQVKDNIDDAIKASDMAIDNHTHKDGNIYPATMKVDNRKVYVVGGYAQMNDDGTGIDHAKSSESIMVRDAETGKIEMVAPAAILSVDEATNAEEEKANAAESIRQTYAQQEANKIDGTLEFNVGDTYSVIGEDNSQHTLQVIGDAVDEKTGQPIPNMVMVSVDGSQQPTMLPKAQVQEMSDGDNMLRLSQSLKQREEAKAAESQSSNTYSLNDEVTLTNEEGMPVRGSITADQNEDGKFEVYTEEPINGKKVNLFSAEELDALNPDVQTKEETPQTSNNELEGEPAQTESVVNLPQNAETISEARVESAENSQQSLSAFERIPKDEQGQPIYEQAEPETAWDAIVEQTGGDEAMAQTVADDMVADMEAAVKKAGKAKTKGGTTIAEKIAAEKERSAAIEQAKQTLAHWKKIASTNRMRQAAIHAEENRKAGEATRLRKEQEDKERAEREEAERQKREALNGVPDFVEDKASDARARGYRRVNGDKVDRQEPLAAVQGKDVQVKFDDKNIPSGHVALIDADELQPSHKNGQRNPLHFIDEAQPKERKDDASKEAARKIASNIRPEEITSSVTAYTGAPTVNSRGEVIQGNNRSAALKEMWAAHKDQGEKYKQYLIDHAAELGLNPDEVRAMEKPILVNMLDVNDDDAIALGQFVASDTESGGVERIKPKNVVKKLDDKMKNFASLLLRSTDEDMSFSELIDRNGVDVLKWMSANGSITPTQYKSAFDNKGNLTAEAKNDLKGIMYQSIFEGGSTQLEEMFKALPAKTQKAILATAYRDYDSPQSERMIEELQNSIMAYYALSHDAQFMAATNHKDARMAVESWKRQYAIDDNTGESYLPAEKYSNFALLLATMYKGDNQSFIQGTFNKMYDLIQGTQEETLFEQPDNTPRTLAEAIKEVLNIDYNGQQRNDVLVGGTTTSQRGEQGSNGDSTTGGRSENSDGTEAHQGGTERESRGNRGQGNLESLAERQGYLGETKEVKISDEVDEDGSPFVKTSTGTTVFGEIKKESGLTPAPIKLSLGNSKYGLIHLEKRHGYQIRGAGFDTVEEFVEFVCKNYKQIKQGENSLGEQNGTYLIQIEDEHNNTLYIELSTDGKYWGVNSGGVFRKGYGKNKKEVWPASEVQSKQSVADSTLREKDKADTPISPNGNVPTTSADKDKQSSDTKQEKERKTSQNNEVREDLFAMAERVAAEDKAKRTRKKEEAKVDTNPTEAQKEAGNYKKGHIKVDGFNVTIEQPKGSVRRGKDANGKEWETEMHNTYGYIRGTESVDGDHIDIFLSDNPTEGNVFVVDQVNKDGSFDEHKVMYGFSDMESARKAYLSNYEEGWQGLGNITEVSKEEFKKWIDSSKRKTKPFAEYSSVRTQGDVQTKKPTEAEDFARQDLKELEDFQKNTDTTGRTTIDVDRYEVEDLFVPLLLDGKTSRLGVLTVVPDKITDPSGQIAVYDYSDEIDEKTNSGWQKWGDLTDEYNKTVDSSDKAQERGDTATLGFTSVDAALKFYDWLNTGGPKIHQTKKSQKESKDSNVFLSQKEYIKKELVSVLKQTKYKTLKEWEDKDIENYVQKYDEILETYEDYVRDLADDEKLQAIYDKSSVKTQKEIREHLTDADLDYHEFINTSPKRLRIQDRLTRKSKYAKGEFSDGTIVSGEVVRWSPTGLTVNSRGTLYTISANKVLEQSNELMNADGHVYQENGSLQYSTKDLTNNTTAKRLATDTILSALNKAGIEVVRATDEQVQELFANTHASSLRAPQGTIYGWSINGKIYLTEAGINPDTPIHEYTHLWAEAMMSKNKKGWNSIKALLKETPVWNEVVADPSYSNITNDEDAVASEVLSRISGRENAARVVSEAQKVIDEDKDVFEKAKSVTLLNRIKRALDMFWKWVGKELFKIKKFGSINEVTDRVLYDLMHSSKLNSNDKSLIGVHNISEQKLRKVLKQGGFANPSIAVIDTDKQVHNDYGEISLILPAHKINKSTGKNAGTFEGDAWTPMYPVVEKQISSDGGITMHNDINAVPKDMQSEVRNALNRWLENGSDTDLSYLYLFQQGKAPQMIVEKPKYSNEVHKTLNDIMFGVNSVYKLSKNEIKKLVELYIQTELDGNIKEYNEAIQRKISKYEELIKRCKPNSLQYRVADSYLEDIEKYGFPLSPLIKFVDDVQRDKIKQGSKNAQKTLYTASQIIKDAGLEKDFKNWVEDLNNRYQIKEVIFDGFTPTGKRRYIPNTLENVSKIMKKQGRQASAGVSISFSNFAAAVMKANGSLDNIRKKKSKLTNEHKDIEDFEEKWKEVYFDLAMKLQPNANMFDDYGFARLQEAANEKNPQTYIRNVYGITLSEEDVQKLQDLVEAIREERPALYFETKFERPVYLNEFSKAVVPEDFSDDLQNALGESGIEVFTYKRGDVEDRQRVTKQAAYSSNDIVFQIGDDNNEIETAERDKQYLEAVQRGDMDTAKEATEQKDSSANDTARSHTFDKEVNEQFNRELAELTEENADTKIFNLGSPSSILLSAGVEDKPMKLYGSKLMKKAKLHGFSPKELQSLPAALTDPIAVFDNYKKTDNRSILTELNTKDGNFLVSLTIGKGIDVDFNIIASAFGKANDSIVKWINKGFATYINKEKALNYLYLSAPIAEAAENSELSSAAKIVKDFVNPNIGEEKLREGYGAYTDDELSFINDPWAKMMGKSNRTAKQRAAFAERERSRMTNRVGELADTLHLDNVEVVTDASQLDGKRANAKGFYSKSTGKITIVIPNHANIADVEKTLLHEAVAHYGLRKLFGDHFDTFLDNVYQNAEPEIRREIVKLATKNGWDFRTATEEYLASLAEQTDFERMPYSFWTKIKQLFMKLLHSIGFENWQGGELSDNELRYILWRSYQNLKEPGRYRSILGEAEDVAKQYELKVGNYAEQTEVTSDEVAEASVGFDEVNERFNDALQQQIDGTLPKGYVYDLGMPSSILLSTGIPNLPIELVASRLSDKSMQENHPFDLNEVKDLPNAIQNPFAVFRSATHIGSNVILTNLKHGGRNYVVAIETNRKAGRIFVNSVRSVHYRNSMNIIGWINDGLADYMSEDFRNSWIEETKNELLSKPQYNSADVRKKLISVANIVKDFENPNISEENVEEDDVLFREGEDSVDARDIYEHRVSRAMFQTQEALQDSMLGLKEAMEAVLKAEGTKTDIADIAGFENAYLGENRLSSVNKAEADAFAHLVFKPMLDEVAKLSKNEQECVELVDYMMAKHGLERNEVMAERDATEAFKANEQAHPNSTKSFDDYLADARQRDYAGLTALTGTDTVEEAEAEAGRMVADYERNNDTTALWKKVNDVTNATLSKSYECGMMNKDTYDKIKSMYQFYIPLRGFDEKTSSEAYAYLTHSQSAFNAPIKVARGRTSKADDPFANMQSMAESAITEGNRNKLVKQKFLNFALNHPSNLVSVSDLWLKYDDVTDEWKPVFPDNIEDTDSADDIEKKLQDFEARMEELAEEEPDKYKHGKDTVNIPYRVVESRDLKQHQVLVKRGGRDYVLTINGNPRAAQALNGQTNPDNDNSGAIGAIFKVGEMVNRQLSAFYTTRNPDFVVSNFIRDMLYANSMVWVKESPNYALRFHRNIGRCNPVQVKILLTKHINGKLNMDNDLERSFYQFMMNGGETGYANMRDIEQHKNDIRRELKRANGKLGITKAINLLGERLDEYNRAVENSARFAAFLTSREMGRTIDRSIYDAKEISVNFNKKGSGAKFMGAVGQTKLGNTSAFLSGLGRSGFVFWNAAIQGTTNFGRQFKKYPAKAFTAAATMFILGALVAGMGMGDGDDDNKNSYWNLPEYVRRSNILFKAGDQWVSIPLPTEYRAIYGMGELMVSAMSGKEHFTNEELGRAIAGQATQILPIDFLEGEGGLKAFIPSAAKPFAEVYTNKSWTGMPIYKDTPYNKDMPEWTKAYKSANKYLLGLSKLLNEATRGDAYTKGAIDLNPAKIEYILNGYFGGVSNTIDKLTKSAETIAGQREYDPRSFLVLNRILKNGDERTESRAINNEYYRAKEEHDKLKARIKHYEKDTDNGVFDYAEKIDFLYNSLEYARYEIFEDYNKEIDGLYAEMKEATDDDERKVIDNELTALKKQMIEEMNATRK